MRRGAERAHGAFRCRVRRSPPPAIWPDRRGHPRARPRARQPARAPRTAAAARDPCGIHAPRRSAPAPRGPVSAAFGRAPTAGEVAFAPGSSGGAAGGEDGAGGKAWRHGGKAAEWRQSREWRHSWPDAPSPLLALTRWGGRWQQCWRQSWRHSGKALAAKQGKVAAINLAALRQNVAAWRHGGMASHWLHSGRQSVAAWRRGGMHGGKVAAKTTVQRTVSPRRSAPRSPPPPPRCGSTLGRRGGSSGVSDCVKAGRCEEEVHDSDLAQVRDSECVPEQEE
eukprot:gene17981-biopygen10720